MRTLFDECFSSDSLNIWLVLGSLLLVVVLVITIAVIIVLILRRRGDKSEDKPKRVNLKIESSNEHKKGSITENIDFFHNPFVDSKTSSEGSTVKSETKSKPKSPQKKSLVSKPLKSVILY